MFALDNNVVYTLNSRTGDLVQCMFTNVRPLGNTITYTAAYNNQMYVYINSNETPTLIRIDNLFTGESTTIKEFPSGTPAGGLVNRNNILYANFRRDTNLYEMDWETGERNVVCSDILPTSGIEISSMTTDPTTGLIYALSLANGSTSPSLYSLDPDACLFQNFGRISARVGPSASIVWNPSTGKFLGSTYRSNKIFDLDLDGMVSNIRGPDTEIYFPEGMQFFPNLMYEPRQVSPIELSCTSDESRGCCGSLCQVALCCYTDRPGTGCQPGVPKDPTIDCNDYLACETYYGFPPLEADTG